MDLEDTSAESGPTDDGGGGVGPVTRRGVGRRPLDQTDVVLGEWLSQHGDEGLLPVALALRVERLSQLLRDEMEQTLRRFDLDWGQFIMLAALRGGGNPFRMSPRELHQLLSLSPAAVTHRLYRLQAKGLIDRAVDAVDHRRMPVILTSQGHSVVDRAMAACVTGPVDVNRASAEDLAVMVATLRVLLDRDEPPVTEGARVFVPAPGAAQPPSALSPPDDVQPKNLWPASNKELERLQRSLSRRVRDETPWHYPDKGRPIIAGVFVSVPTARLVEVKDHMAWAGAVVIDGNEITATATATRRLCQRYRVGHLAAAVGPIVADLVQSLSQQVDLVVINAAGIDHVRGAGLAIQLGAALNVATVGVTELPSQGSWSEPGTTPGCWTPVRMNRRTTGYCVRTLDKAKPITAHAGWRTTAETARDVVISTTSGDLRFPLPLHRARQLSARLRHELMRSADAGLLDGIHDQLDATSSTLPTPMGAAR